MANTTDKRFYQLTLAIQKAINANETPVKEKHVRSTIIGTFQEQSAVTYWMVAVRLPIQDNRIVAWKFCHVTHKLLREGHPACLDDSQRHINMIENLGKLWVHLREGYGKLVHLYCNLLVCKLKFHSRNPRFPGNMQLTAEELDAIAENDVNNYFQLCVELFDYMDEILNLQASVFDSLGNARANSMTASGQCRLAALIPCAQDASQIYDCNVRLLFRLHASLPADTLSGHRERFRQQFKKLSSFYKHASSLQYYRNLLTLPVLPSNPPNFLLQSDFGTYVTPVVSIPEPSPDELDTVASLIDTSDTISQAPSDNTEDLEARSSASPQPDPIVERDRLIDHLQNELKRMRSEVSQLVQERNTMLGSMREHCTRIESQLQNAKVQLEEEKQKAQLLSVQTPEIKQKLSETEERAKVQDEKFQKLKGAYTQLREEHIALIRQKAEVDKLSASLRAAAAQHESAKLALQQQLNDRIKDVELLQQSASSSEEIEAYKTQITNLRSDIETARQKEIELETLRASMEALEIEHKTATQEQEEKISTLTNELKETTENLEKLKKEKEESEKELLKVKEVLVEIRDKSSDEYKKVLEEKEAALNQVAELKQQHLQEKEELNRLNNNIKDLQSELDSLQQKISIIESDREAEKQILNEEIKRKNEEINKIVTEKDFSLNEAVKKVTGLEEELRVKITEVSTLQGQVNDLLAISDKFKIESEEKDKVVENFKERNEYIKDLENKLKSLELDKNFEIVELHEDSQKMIEEKNEELDALKKLLTERNEFIEKQNTENEKLSMRITELNECIQLKTMELAELNVKLDNIASDMLKDKAEYENSLSESNVQIALLKDKLQHSIESREEIVASLKEMIAEKDEQVISLNVDITKLSEEKTEYIRVLENRLKCLELDKNFEIVEMHEDSQKLIVEKNEEVNALNILLAKRDELIEKQKTENETLSKRIIELNQSIELKTAEFADLNMKLEKVVSDFQEQKVEYDSLLKESNIEVTILKDKLQNVIESKAEMIANLKSMIAEKDAQVIALNVEVTKLSEESSRLKDELEETKAELEIGNDELFTLKEAHESIEDKLALRSEELRKVRDEITEVTKQNEAILKENDRLTKELNTKTEVFESRIQEVKQSIEVLKTNHGDVKFEKEILAIDLNNEIEILKMNYKHLKDDKDNETQMLNAKICDLESFYEKEISQKNEAITLADMNLKNMREELEKLQTLVTKERSDSEVVLTEKDYEKQDLLQHNTVLEADLAAVKKQLEDAKKALEKQTSRLVTCVGEATLEVTNEAITAFEHANAQETIKNSAELAAKALEQLAQHSNVSGNEESIAKSAIVAAHNTAQLSAYVVDVSHISTNMELSDKLSNECRSMLIATKECLESVKKGSLVSSKCSEAQSLVRSMMTSAAAADRQNTGARSVDDELADMDRAIEEAASQIESMLAAARSSDSGVKLEVNGKILDACTTLMGAVKILVQDARKLQNELGDPKTRQKMYRKNPQWSEGLISAAKAVVFAAKLLVTSADEAVGASGQVEGVSAAAHEVAGSTAQLVAASRARAPPESPALARLTHASRDVAAATGALLAAVKAGSALVLEQDSLDTSSLSLTATRRLEMESKVRSLKLETALDAERVRLAALRKRHYHLAQLEENGNVENGKD